MEAGKAMSTGWCETHHDAAGRCGARRDAWAVLGMAFAAVAVITVLVGLLAALLLDDE